jgi:hypothetical protein
MVYRQGEFVVVIVFDAVEITQTKNVYSRIEIPIYFIIYNFKPLSETVLSLGFYIGRVID